MLQALRRIEDRRQDGDEPARLVRPRRVRPAEPVRPEAAPGDHGPPAESAIPAAFPAQTVATDPCADPAPSVNVNPAPAATAVEAELEPGALSNVLEASGLPPEGSAPTSAVPEPAGPPAASPEQVLSPQTGHATPQRPDGVPRIRRLDAQFYDLAAGILARVPGQPAVIGLCVLEPESRLAVAPLAVAMVQQLPGEVVLVEADLSQASLAESLGAYAGQSNRIPLDVLRTGKGWAQLARPTGVFRLSLLAGMARLPVAAPQGVSLWEAAAEELRQEHQLVLVVAGPPEAPTAQAALACCDGVFVLATLHHTGTRRARRGIQSIREIGRTVWGVILIAPA